MSADFFGDDCFIVATSIEGEIFIYGTERQKRVFTHETLPPMIAEWQENRRPIEEGFVDPSKKLTAEDVPPTNVIYAAKGLKNVPGEENCFLLGAQDTQVQKFRKSFNGVAVTGRYVGHSMGVRSLELSKDASMLLTGCDDHSLRVWDYKTGKADLIFAGHQDVVVSTKLVLILLDWRHFRRTEDLRLQLVGHDDQGLGDLSRKRRVFRAVAIDKNGQHMEIVYANKT
jgi:WD40 repeat protein